MAKKPAKKTAKKAKKSPARKGKSFSKAKKAPSKGRKMAKPKAARKPSAPSGSVIPVLCSECDEPLLYAPGASGDSFTCPECLATVKKPNEDFLHTVEMHMGSEKRWLVLAVVMMILTLGSLAGLIYIASPQNAPADENLQMIFLGASALFAILSIALVFKYEKTRWQIYF